MSGLRTLLAFHCFLALGLAEPVRTAEECAVFLRPLVVNAFQQKFDLAIPLHIHDRTLKHAYLPLKQTGTFYDPEALYIGIANNLGADGFHHYYLVSGNRRFDAIPGKPAKVHDTKSGSAPIITQGVVFRLKLPAEVRAKVMADMKAREGTDCLTCLHPVIEILNENGIHIAPDGHGMNQLSTAQISTGLLSGQATWNGKPVPTEAFATSSGQVAPYLVNAMNMDEMARARLEARPKPAE